MYWQKFLAHAPDVFLQPLASGLQQIHLSLQLSLLVLELFERPTQLPDGLEEAGVLLPALLEAPLRSHSSFLEENQKSPQVSPTPKSKAQNMQELAQFTGGPRATETHPNPGSTGLPLWLGEELSTAKLPAGWHRHLEASLLLQSHSPSVLPSPEPGHTYFSFQLSPSVLLQQLLPSLLQRLLLQR